MRSGKNIGRMDKILKQKEVRVIDVDGEQLGVMDPKKALSIAEEKGFSLVEVASNAEPPVVKIMDYGKYKYEQSKREKVKRRNQKQEKTKQIKLTPSTAEHDFDFKKQHVRDFLESGAKTLLTVKFRGRQITHPELGRQLLTRMADDLSDVATVASPAQLKGYTMSMLLEPASQKS